MVILRQLVIWSLLLITAGCDESQPIESAPHPSQIKLSIDLWPGYYPVIIASEKGWFQQAGIDVKVDWPGNTDKMLAAFAAGRIDMVAVALGDAVSVANTIKDVQVILMTDESSGGDALLSYQPDILKSLSGKRIGTNLGGFGEVLVREMLQRYAIEVEDVDLVNVDASDVPKLLKDNVLDVGHTWQPYVDQAVSQGASVVFSSADTPGLIPDIIAIRQSHFQTTPERLRAFVKTWFKAVAWWQANPEEGNQIVSNTIEQPVASISLNGIRLLNAQENKAYFSSQEKTGLINTIHTYSTFYQRVGILSAPVEGSMLLNSQYIP